MKGSTNADFEERHGRYVFEGRPIRKEGKEKPSSGSGEDGGREPYS
jgi:hypothetical protein